MLNEAEMKNQKRNVVNESFEWWNNNSHVQTLQDCSLKIHAGWDDESHCETRLCLHLTELFQTCGGDQEIASRNQLKVKS